MNDHELSFIASMTVCPSDIRKIKEHIVKANVPINPLENALITPLFVSEQSLQMVRELADEGSQVYFDSGGYYVQMGRLRYEELYYPLLKVYQNNTWASVYTLPDQVPTSQDDAETVDIKIKNTITYSEMFFYEMPDELKPKAMPVVQGHTYQQIDACLEAYLRLGVNFIGFGSFGTSGPNSEINIATKDAVELARYVIQVAHENNVKVHLFGLGTPALVAMIKGIGADSFDSATWLKSAGFGQIFLPFMRAYNITYRNTSSHYQKGTTVPEFESRKILTNHECALCSDVELLQASKMSRAAHNLIVMAETVNMVNAQQNYNKIAEIYANGSVRYRQEYEKWLTN